MLKGSCLVVALAWTPVWMQAERAGCGRNKKWASGLWYCGIFWDQSARLPTLQI